MTDWPEGDASWQDDALLFDVGVVQRVVGLGREARGQSGVRTRQPLSRLLLRAPSDPARKALELHSEQILEELNVKAIEFIARDASHVSYRYKPKTPVLGKRGRGKEIPEIKQALAEQQDATIAGNVERGQDTVISVPSGTLTLASDEVLVETESAEGFTCAEEDGYMVELDTALTDELIDEGMAREIVRSVQDARKQAGLEVSDRIELGISGSKAVEQALKKHRDYVMAETLATGWTVGQKNPLFSTDRTLGDDHWRIEFSKQ